MENVGALPAGFRKNATGLIVPEEHSRAREPWTWQEWRDLERVTKLLTRRGIKLLLGCDKPHCPDRKLERLRNLDGSITLRCGCRDRTFTKAY